MEQRRSTFDFPLTGTGPRDREAVAREIDRLDLPANARKILRAIFNQLWPQASARPLDIITLPMPELRAITNCSKGTISPQLQLLKAAHWIQTEGKGDKYRLNWPQLFTTNSPGEPGAVSPRIEDRLTSQPNPDRSNRSNSQIGPVQPVQFKSPQNWTGPTDFGPVGPVQPEQAIDDLDRLDRSNNETWTGPTQPRDAFSPLERVTSELDDVRSELKQLRELVEVLIQSQPEVGPVQLILDRLDQLDRSNRSNSDPHVCNTCNVKHVHVMYGEVGPVQSSQQETPQDELPDARPSCLAVNSDPDPLAIARLEPDPTQTSLPFPDPDGQETPPMPKLGDFRWPEDLYDRDKGLDPVALERATGRDRLWQWAVTYANWPNTPTGRVEFWATVIYCRRRGETAGAMLTSAVKGRHHGSRGWWSKQDLQAAYACCGRPDATQASGGRKPPDSPANQLPPRDYTDLDNRLAAMTEPELRNLLTNDFARALFDAARAKGQPLLQPVTVLTMLRRGLEQHALAQASGGRKPPDDSHPVSSLQPTASIDTHGLDLELAR